MVRPDLRSIEGSCYGGDTVYVGVLKLALLCRDSHSLKDKRAVVRSLKARVEQKFGIGVAEVGALDTWQRIELGLALAASDRDHVGATLGHVIGFVRSLELADLVEERRDVFTYGDDEVGWRSATTAAIDQVAPERTGGGDKAGADDWVPPEWTEEPT
jgi:uncharacterized protein